MKKGFIVDIEKETLENDSYRKVLYTSNYSQLVVMSIEPGDEIGEEVHGLDQFIRFEEGKGKVVLGAVEHEIEGDWAVVIPAGVKHNVINNGTGQLKLYSVYSPPGHKDDTIHHTKEDEKEEHYDGSTSE